MALKWSFLVAAVAAHGIAGPAAAQGARQATPSAKPSGAAATTAFVNVSVIPMDREQVLDGQTVIVRGDKITEVGPATTVKVPAGATRVEGKGRFLMPGLGDMHVHFFPPEDEKNEGLPDWYAEPRLFCYVANGVTRIRVIDPNTMVSDIQQRVASRQMVGPRVYAVGNMNPDRPRRRRDNNDANEQEMSDSSKLVALRAAGYDFLLVSADPPTPPQGVSRSLATMAAAAGLRLAGDIPGYVSLDTALSAPYGSIEQLQGYLEQIFLTKPEGQRLSTIDFDSIVRVGAQAGAAPINSARMTELVAATQRAGVWNVPIQSEAERMVQLWSGSAAVGSSTLLQGRRKLVKALQDAGAGLLLGTDAPAWGGDYGAAVHEELEALVAAGLTPYQALATGTQNIGKFLNDSAGAVAPGQRADLVLLTGNPLQDVRHAKEIVGVMLAGRWVTREKIGTTLKADACTGK